MPARDLSLLLFVCLIWAGNFIAVAFAVSMLPPVLCTVVRFALVLALLLPFLRPPARDQWPLLVAVCLTIGALHFGLVFLAMSRSGDVSSVAILMQTYVPMTTLLAVVFLGERVGWRTTAAVGLAFAGVLLVGFDPEVVDQLDAVGLVLLSALCLAAGTVMMRRLRGIGMFSFQAWNAAISLPFLAAMSTLIEPDAWTRLPEAGVAVWLALGYSAVGASIIGHGSFYRLIQKHPVTDVTPYLLLVPVMAVGLGVLVWGDRPGWRLLAGGGLVLVGVLWVSLRVRRKKQAMLAGDAVPESS